MYKQFDITKRFTISFEVFRKQAKTLGIDCYNNGFHKWRDYVNGINFYSVVVGTFRITLIRQDKHKRGCSAS